MDIANMSGGIKKPEENADEKVAHDSEKFGKVIDTLHNKSKLSSLRTYQGDMAEFIKEKNESVFSITIKEKERKDEREKKEEEIPEQGTGDKKLTHLADESAVGRGTSIKLNPQGLKKNLIIIVSSIVLIALGTLAGFYVFKFLKTEPVATVVIEQGIIPYNSAVTLSGATDENFGQKLTEISPTSGVNVIKISGNNGLPISSAQNFFNFLKISLPGALERNLKDEYMVGIISQKEESYPFIVITVSDFGNAFSAMLDWETNMEKDLAFLNAEKTPAAVSPVATTATTTATTTTANIPAPVATPIKQGPFAWKDLIIKNKDARGLTNQKGQAEIVYTFLDKNTILITNDTAAIAEISAVYASRAVVR
jgi:hypothetical protein